MVSAARRARASRRLSTAPLLVGVIAAVLALAGCGPATTGARPSAVFLGDSITKGAGDGGWYASLVDGRDPALRYLAAIAENGMTTAWMLDQVPEALAARPDLLVVLGGTNDVSMGIPPRETIDHLAAMADRAEQAGVRLAVATIPPFDDPERASAAVALNERIRALARDRGLLLLDTAAAVSDASGDWADPGLTTDGVHPTAEGSRRMAAAAAEALAAAR